MPKMFMVTCIKELSFAVVAEDLAEAKAIADMEADEEDGLVCSAWEVTHASEVARRKDLLESYTDEDFGCQNPRGDHQGKTLVDWCDELGLE